MQIIRDPSQCLQSSTGHALTIGAYDGVHLGHRAVIRATQRQASSLGLRTAVVTFDPHPALVLRPATAPKLLTDIDHKLELLAECDVDTVVVVPFDEVRATETPEEFVQEVLVDCLDAKSITVGHDFRFGADRAGNVSVLRSMGQKNGFAVEGVKLLPRPDGKGESVSSTAIRRALAGGEVVTAARMLGRNHEIRGTVTGGDQRGRTIGFPTANVAVPAHLAVPADAVYAAWYHTPDGERRPAAVNVGKRPTFRQDAEHSSVEAHLIGFEGDLYDQPARVEFVELIRSEQRFDGVEDLKVQLGRDVQRATDILDRDGWSG